MIDTRALHQIGQRLSLRKPQTESLRRLADVVDLIAPSKDTDIEAAREAVRAVYGDLPDADFEDFERDFPSLCFALATGVGKTRLMGAFVSYMFMTGKSRNFFVLAPNLTIYEKLLADFQPSSPKYVFKGVEVFAHQPPLIVNAENYEEGRGVRGADLLGREAAIINIFNISKINTDTASAARKGVLPRIKRLQEYIGESYFSYLAGLPDLVLLMDEAHRYRASAGAKAISELKPILGLEVTATPKAVGGNAAPFKNVVYRYDLPSAMEDGYVKEPAVGTRANFKVKSVSDDTTAGSPTPLERIKLEDGVHYHEHVKVQLQTYARQNAAKVVHPFMLVVAADIRHAEDIKTFVESSGFFGGRYAGRVITVHSKKSGEESDETAAALLAVESSGATDIVIHVNKLKEGWDVSNLFTIVPLRASTSEILTEQTLGRGLRLPYGKRTGVEAIDTLTVISHDRFDEIIDQAQNANGLIHKKVLIGEGGDVPIQKPVMVEAPSAFSAAIERAINPTAPPPTGVKEADAPRFEFTPAEAQLARVVGSVLLPKIGSKVGAMSDLKSERTIRQATADAIAVLQADEGLFKTEITPERAEEVTAEVFRLFVAQTIAIPQIVVTPETQVSFGFEQFSLEGLQTISLQPDSPELVTQNLRTGQRTVISRDNDGDREPRLENYIVRELIAFDEIDYAEHATLLFDLAGQVIARLRAYLPDDDAVFSVVERFGRYLAEFVFTQMKQHMWRTRTTYRITVGSAFSELKPQNYNGAGQDAVRDFRLPLERPSEIKRFVFSGFKKCCYHLAKFDSDQGERRMAVLLEDEPTVEKWMKPGPGQFRLEDADGHAYQPDFVVETKTEKLIIEPKRRDEINDPAVLRKAEAAMLWCHRANEHYAKRDGEKPWRYLLVPHDEITPSATLAGLLAAHTKVPDMDLLSRFEMTAA